MTAIKYPNMTVAQTGNNTEQTVLYNIHRLSESKEHS